MPRIRESHLLMPALYIIGQTGGANTTHIKNELIRVFQPSGEDNELLAGRADTKFTQIVRNLLGSHYTTNGMALYTHKGPDGRFTLTAQGQAMVELHAEAMQDLFSQRQDYGTVMEITDRMHQANARHSTVYVYREDDVVAEGRATLAQTRVRERSQRLRRAAIAHYTVDGRIRCAVCGFDFYEVYGELGEGYIQIHHETPVCQYSDQGEAQYIRDAVHAVKPVCSNCHCMLHRGGGEPMPVQQLTDIIRRRRENA